MRTTKELLAELIREANPHDDALAALDDDALVRECGHNVFHLYGLAYQACSGDAAALADLRQAMGLPVFT